MVTNILGVFFWPIMGALLILIQFGITLYLKKKDRNTIGLQIGGFLANFLLIFTLMWAYTSFAEREYQAVAMGFVFFGGLTLIPAVITWRLANMKKGDVANFFRKIFKKGQQKESAN